MCSTFSKQAMMYVYGIVGGICGGFITPLILHGFDFRYMAFLCGAMVILNTLGMWIFLDLHPLEETETDKAQNWKP
jgi:hypothetical protein